MIFIHALVELTVVAVGIGTIDITHESPWYISIFARSIAILLILWTFGALK